MNAMNYWRPAGVIAGLSPAVGSYVRLDDAPDGMAVFATPSAGSPGAGSQFAAASYVPATATDVRHYIIPISNVPVATGAQSVTLDVVAQPVVGPARVVTVAAGDGVTVARWADSREVGAASASTSATLRYVAVGAGVLGAVGLA